MSLLQQLVDIENKAGQIPEIIQQLEGQIEELTKSNAGSDVRFLTYRNGFRVRNANLLKVRRPRILLGMINYDFYPTFQSLPLLKFADVVSLSDQASQENHSDRVFFNFETEDFSDILQRLPEGFDPDYYWDPQICGVSLPPAGLEEAPFPTVAGICHTFRGVNVDFIARLYDAITPVSKPFSELFNLSHPEKRIIDTPFGGNWGSFDSYIPDTDSEKDIDLLVSFSKVNRYEYGPYRNQVYDLCQAFAEKYGEQFNIEFLSGVDRDTYIETLQKSKIAVNACGFNGPYNYRTCEVMNANVLLMQIATDFPVKQSLSDYFEPDQDYIEFTPEDFEVKLLGMLQDDAQRAAIAQKAKEKLERDFSYEAIHKNIVGALDEDEKLLERRVTGYDAFKNWLKALASSPIHHHYKRRLFAKLASAIEVFDDSDSIRFGLMSIPIFVDEYGDKAASMFINSSLSHLLTESTYGTIDYLTNLIPASELTIADRWYLACCKARYSQADTNTLHELINELKQLESLSESCPTVDWLVLYDLNINNATIKNGKLRVLDIPHMQYAGNVKEQNTALVNYMILVCEHFINNAKETDAEAASTASAMG